MKPRLFVGSSLESLEVGHAVQQNLWQDAEVTVWDQGVFKLSATGLESLLQTLDTHDFAAFVFSDDDLVTIRGEESRSVRDNVLLELGLFIGRLGRDRCFILMPDCAPDLRIPTDLLGATPGIYESKRTDGNLRAGVAPACQDVRAAIRQTGRRIRQAAAASAGPEPAQAQNRADPEQAATVAATEGAVTGKHAEDREWFIAYVCDDLERARALLGQQIDKASDVEARIHLQSWLGRIEYRLNPAQARAFLERLIQDHPSSAEPYVHLAYAHLHQGLASEALAVVERAPLTVADRPSVIKAKVRCLDELGRSDEVESVLREAIAVYPDKPDFYLALAEHLKERGDNEGARWALDDGVQALPRNEAILARLARLLSEHFDKTLALHLYEQLCWLKPDSPEYPTLLANILLELELNDSAMHKYRRANELAEGKQAWILANIGNLYKNRGFFREGIDFLQRALQLEPEDQYAHERLAAAIKLRDEEEKRLEDILQNARKELARQRDTKKQPKQ